MNRKDALDEIASFSSYWDLIVVGGGATGLGTAVDAAARGYKTLLLEQHDFAKGTSSRSTKLVHGGVRYLRQGNVTLVLEALHERGLLSQNAPHLVHNQSFIVPIYDWWEGPFYGIGLKVSYCGVVFWHWFTAGIPSMWKPFAVADLVFLVLFVWAYLRLGRAP